MIKISHVVREILFSSEIALSAYQSGCLNLSAYADRIQREVVRRTKKSVSRGSIVAALSRLREQLPKSTELLPTVPINSLSLHSALTEYAFAKSPPNRKRLAMLEQGQGFQDATFFTATLGVSEISIIVPEVLKKEVKKVFRGETPLKIADDLVGITLTFGAKFLVCPNVIFALLRPLALKRINVYEIVSTLSELTIIIDQKDVDGVVSIYNKMTLAAR